MLLEPQALAQAAARFTAARQILLVTHARPDGDAVGSLLGLGLALQASGRQAQMVIEDGLPSEYRLLEGSDQVRKTLTGDFDLLCLLDCSEAERVGAETLRAIQAQRPAAQPLVDVNLDHHLTNIGFAQVNLVDAQAVATAQVIAELLPACGFSLTKPVATALLTGLITDTIGFRTSNMRPEVLRLAADLMETGVNLSEIYRRTLVERSFEAVRLWGAGLSKIEREERLAWTTLTRLDRQEAHYPGRDDADLINFLTAINGVDVAVIFVEQSNESVKVSWRATPGFDVAKVAMSFGGGGHAAASGAEISGSLPQVQARVLEQTRLLFNGGNCVQ